MGLHNSTIGLAPDPLSLCEDLASKIILVSVFAFSHVTILIITSVDVIIGMARMPTTRNTFSKLTNEVLSLRM